jgi:hypothetical protein
MFYIGKAKEMFVRGTETKMLNRLNGLCQPVRRRRSRNTSSPPVNIITVYVYV